MNRRIRRIRKSALSVVLSFLMILSNMTGNLASLADDTAVYSADESTGVVPAAENQAEVAPAEPQTEAPEQAEPAVTTETQQTEPAVTEAHQPEPVTTQATLQDSRVLSNTELRQISNNQRIAHDQEALANLSSIFLGKSQNEIKNMLNGPSFDAYDPSKGLSQATLLFDYDINNTGDEDGSVQTYFRNAKASPDVLLQWMEGNYIQSDKKIKEKTYNERVFLSDDLIDPSGVLNGMEHEAGTYAASVRCAFTFDSDGKCDSVRTWVTRTKKQDGTGNWLRYECEGLTKIVVTK